MNLDVFIAQRKDSPFVWGENDCCLFVADWLKVTCGIDYGVNFRYHYKSKRGAFKTLFKAGFKDIKSVFKHHLNSDIKLQWARRGDVALVNHSDELVGGIVGLNCVYCLSASGIVTLPLACVDSVYCVRANHD